MIIVKYLKYDTYLYSMSKREINVYECRCERCGHNWITRTEDLPVVCPKCKSPYWNKPVNNKSDKNGK